MIPGPTEFSEEVLASVSTIGTSHVDPSFIEAFGFVLDSLPAVFAVSADESDCVPVVLAGSGTLGWDVTAGNFVERGEDALVINAGYFGDSFGDCLASYGVNVTQLRPAEDAPVGTVVRPEELRAALQTRLAEGGSFYKLVTITQVDTSTGALSPVAEYAAVVRELAPPTTLIAIDGVCSISGEELRMTDWDIDIAFTGSQKSLGVPPGLLVAMFRNRAVNALRTRQSPPPLYYGNLNNWMPVLSAYRARKPAYFATPPVQLILALHAALTTRVLAGNGVVDRVAEHRRAARAFRAALRALGLSLLVGEDEKSAANTLSAVRFPAGVNGPELLGALKKHGVICAGGLHKACRAEYFRVGHMGVSVASPEHLRIVVAALEASLSEQSFCFTAGAGLAAFEAAWNVE